MFNTLSASTLGLLPILAEATLIISMLGLLYPDELGGGGNGGGSGKTKEWGQRPVDYRQYYARPKHATEDVSILAVAAGLVF